MSDTMGRKKLHKDTTNRSFYVTHQAIEFFKQFGGIAYVVRTIAEKYPQEFTEFCNTWGIKSKRRAYGSSSKEG